MNVVSFFKDRLGVSQKKTIDVKLEINEDKELRTCHFNFLMTPSLYNKLSETSKRIGKSKSSIVNSAISEFLKQI